MLSTTPRVPRTLATALVLIPGILLCAGIAVVARGLQRLEETALGQPYLEALVLAILVGAVVRAAWTPDARWAPGIRFSAKGVLECAVALLGLSMDLPALARNGLALPLAITVVVAMTLVGSYGLGRALGLGRPLAVLIACGNAICGNSAIAAVAPAIEADGEDVAAAIAITAALGVVVVVWLPSCVPLLGLSATQYGAIAGLTVYAVPQVVAATVPVGAAAVQIPGVTPLLAGKLSQLGLLRSLDLVLHLPLRYEDETRITPISEAGTGAPVQIEARVNGTEVMYRPRRQLLVRVADDSGEASGIVFVPASLLGLPQFNKKKQ